MRPLALLLAAALATALTGCANEEPPPRSGTGVTTPTIPGPADIDDPCTEYAVALLDNLLVELPSVDEQTAQKAMTVAEQFQARYGAVITDSGIEAARERYTDEIAAACAG